MGNLKKKEGNKKKVGKLKKKGEIKKGELAEIVHRTFVLYQQVLKIL